MDSNYSQALTQEFQKVLRRKHAHLAALSKHGPSKHGPSKQKNWLSGFAQALLDFLTGETALSIKKQQNAKGETVWAVYDSRTDTRHLFNSQQAVCVWLETKYRR